MTDAQRRAAAKQFAAGWGVESAGIPPVFRWAFEELEEQEKPKVSSKAQKAFRRARKRAR